jgi:short-subunit dehydrogenase
VNNAGVAAKGDTFDLDVFNYTFQTVTYFLIQNFYGTIDFTEKILPLLSNNGKIVTLGSMAGKMSFNRIKNEEIQKRFKNPELTK